MSDTTYQHIIILFLAVCALLAALTLFGEALRARYGPKRDNPVIETYVTRVNSWWTMVLLFVLALLLGRTGVVALFAFASFSALREFLTLTVKRQADHIALALAFFLVLPLQYLFVGLGWQAVYSVFVPVYAFLMLPVVSALRGDSSGFLVRVAETQWGLMITVFCASHVPALLNVSFPDYPADRGLLLIAFLVMVVQFGDLLDFYFGRRLGRTRIVPGLSPKTWEGAVLGVLSAGLIGGALAWLTPFPAAGAIAMAAVASLFGQAGRLVFAAIKRDRGVRDWSDLIPGQGGFVDQMDSVMFAAPVFYHLTQLIWGT